MYLIVFSPKAKKELLAFPNRVILNLESKIDGLSNNPRPAGCKKLQGSVNEYRIRAGSYRIIYTIADVVRVITIIKIADRKDAYK